MRLTLYYICHTFKNQLKKLFKSHLLLIIAAFVVIGAIIGIFVGMFASSFGSGGTGLPDETVSVQDGQADVVPLTPSERAEAAQIFELAAGGVALFVLALHILTGKKSGSSIFLLPDANLLFPAPLKPQTILMFRLIIQMGSMVAASVYLLFQIPNLCLNLGLGLWSALGILAAWLFIVIYSKLLSVLTYTLSSVNARAKKLVLPFVCVCAAAIGASFFIYLKTSGEGLYAAAKSFFNAAPTRYIPIFGWVKGMAVGAFTENIKWFVIYAALLAVGIVPLAAVIWRIKADFYEDALQKSSEIAEAVNAARENGVPAKGKKARSEKLERDGFSTGRGANVYYYKALYNRRRFAKFGVISGTSAVYMFIALAVSLALKYIFSYESFAVFACIMGAVVFFRSLGNPIAQDVKQSCFFMIPESAYKKMFYSMLGGTAVCLFDLVPAFVISFVMLGGSPARALLFLILVTAIGFYSSNVGVFLDVAISTSVAKAVRSAVQIMIIYLGMLPVMGIMIAGVVLGRVAVFTAVSALFCLALGALFSVLSPKFIEKGLK